MSSYRETVDRWATTQGFGGSQAFAGSRTPVGGDPSTRYAGFYLLMFDDDSYYLGESVNLKGRMGGHNTLWGKNIEQVRFIRQNLSKQQLRTIERGLIHELNAIVPTRCRNKTHASVHFGKDELADFLDLSEQQRWFDSPLAFNLSDASGLKPMSEAQGIKYKAAAEKYLAHPEEQATTVALRRYLLECVPVPKQTEFHGWNVSTGTYGGRRLLCVCVGRMETFVMFPGGTGFVVVRKSTVLSNGHSLTGFKRTHPNVRVKEREYDDSGADTLTLDARTPESFRSLLEDKTVLRAGAQLVLDVMRKHPSVYTRYHCPQVVERVFSDKQRASSKEIDSLQTSRESVKEAGAAARAADQAPTLRRETVPDSQFEALRQTTDDIPDDFEIAWFVNAGPQKSSRNTIADFVESGEWRMNPNPKFESHVQSMLPGERIAVRRRRNTQQDVPFDTRGHSVSVMDILLTGTIVSNPGDGCSVKVRWDASIVPRQWYLYTNQDAVWAVPYGLVRHNDELIAFIFDGGIQNIDRWRNAPFWRERFGD